MYVSYPTENSSNKEARIEGWDYLRFLAFVDITCLHLFERHLLGGLGLPSFVIITCALALTTSSPSLTDLTRVRMQRLLLPWMFWSVVLGAQIALAQLKHGEPVIEGFQPYMLFCGTGQHLWFLPYAAMSGILVYTLHSKLAHIATKSLIAVCMIVAGTLLSAQEYSQGMSLPFRQWLFASPGIPLGLALGRVLRVQRDAQEARTAWIVLGVGLLITMAGVLALGRGDHTASVVQRFALAFALLVSVAWLKIPSTPIMRELRPLMFGAYVLHPVVGFQLMRFTRDQFPLLALTTVGTLALVMLLRRTPLRTFL